MSQPDRNISTMLTVLNSERERLNETKVAANRQYFMVVNSDGMKGALMTYDEALKLIKDTPTTAIDYLGKHETTFSIMGVDAIEDLHDDIVEILVVCTHIIEDEGEALRWKKQIKDIQQKILSSSA